MLTQGFFLTAKVPVPAVPTEARWESVVTQHVGKGPKAATDRLSLSPGAGRLQSPCSTLARSVPGGIKLSVHRGNLPGDVPLLGCLPVSFSLPPLLPAITSPKIYLLSKTCLWVCSLEQPAETSSCHQSGTACVSHTPVGRTPWRSMLSRPQCQAHALKSGPFGPSVRKRMWHLHTYCSRPDETVPSCLLIISRCTRV